MILSASEGSLHTLGPNIVRDVITTEVIVHFNMQLMVIKNLPPTVTDALLHPFHQWFKLVNETFHFSRPFLGERLSVMDKLVPRNVGINVMPHGIHGQAMLTAFVYLLPLDSAVYIGT